MSCLPSPGRMSKTHFEACRRNGAGPHRSTNPFSAYSPKLVWQTLVTRATASGRCVGAWRPVVKAFNSIVIERFNQGSKDGGRRVIFVSGDPRQSQSNS
jgi:predicted dinucleotide-binding enzyme